METWFFQRERGRGGRKREREREREGERSCHKFHFLPWNAADRSPLRHSVRRQSLKVHRDMILSLYPHNFPINHLENSRGSRALHPCALNIRRKMLPSKICRGCVSRRKCHECAQLQNTAGIPRQICTHSGPTLRLRAARLYLSAIPLFLRFSDGYDRRRVVGAL